MPHPSGPHANGSTNGHPSASVSAALYDQQGVSLTSHLHDLIETLWKGKWLLLAVFTVVVAAAAIYTYRIPPQYRTASLLLINREPQTVVQSFGGKAASPFASQDNTISNELFVLQQSQVIARRVAQRVVDLERHPQTQRPFIVAHGAQGQLLPVHHVAARVRGRMSAYSARRDVDAIEIAITSTNPSEAAFLANVYAEEYIARTKEKSRESMQASRDFLNTQSSKLRAEVRAIEDSIQQYMQRTGAVALDRETDRSVQQIADLEARRAELQIQRNMRQAERDTLRSQLRNVESDVVARLSSNVESELTRVQEAAATLDGTIQQIKERNPTLDTTGTSVLARDLRAKKQRLARLRQRSDSLARQLVDQALPAEGLAVTSADGLQKVAAQRERAAELTIAISGLEAQLAVVNDQLEEARQTLRTIPAQSMELAQLQRERRSTERIYGFVQEKLQEIRVSEESEVGYAEVVREAGVPRVPISPDVQRNLILAAIFGFFLGAGLVVLRQQFDTRLRQPDDLRDLGHRVLGVVPTMEPLVKSEFGGAQSVEVDGQSVNTTLAMLVSPMSAPAEAYRRIRANLQFARPDATVQVIAVTSAEKGDGKTTTSVNLALAMASAGKETLLVDADLRRPRLHDILQVPSEPGLSQLLFSEEPFDPAPFRTHVDDFSVIPSGGDVLNPAELLGSERMAHFLSQMRERYAFVIIDTPPVLLFSDALALSSRCDGTIVVTASGKTDRRALTHATDLLDGLNAHRLGCILNRYKVGATLYGRGYNYGYAYSYRRLSEYYEDPIQKGTPLDRLRSWIGR